MSRRPRKFVPLNMNAPVAIEDRRIIPTMADSTPSAKQRPPRRVPAAPIPPPDTPAAVNSSAAAWVTGAAAAVTNKPSINTSVVTSPVPMANKSLTETAIVSSSSDKSTANKMKHKAKPTKEATHHNVSSKPTTGAASCPWNTVRELLAHMRTKSYPSTNAAVTDMKAMLTGFAFRDSADDSRFLFSTMRTHGSFGKPIYHQANGLIIDTNEWRILAASTPMINPKQDLKFVRRNFNKYKVYPIFDGTVITLYHWQSQWHIGSSHGVDMSEYKWTGPKTYREMFDELLVTTTLTLDKLDKTKCYIVGFRHHNMHPYLMDPQKIWFINAYKFVDDEIISVYNEELQLFADTGIMIQQPITIKFDDMMSLAKDALPKGLCNYGYILRAPFDECGENSNILIESSLMYKIRKLMYNMPKPCDRVGQIPIDNTTRQNYLCLRAYLDYNSRAIFIKLFPQFSQHYAEYKLFIERLVNRILQCYRNKYTQSKVLGGEQTMKKESAIIDRLAQVFVMHIRNKERINPYDNITRDILIDYVTNPNYIALYSGLLKFN